MRWGPLLATEVASRSATPRPGRRACRAPKPQQAPVPVRAAVSPGSASPAAGRSCPTICQQPNQDARLVLRAKPKLVLTLERIIAPRSTNQQPGKCRGMNQLANRANASNTPGDDPHHRPPRYRPPAPSPAARHRLLLLNVCHTRHSDKTPPGSPQIPTKPPRFFRLATTHGCKIMPRSTAAMSASAVVHHSC